MYFQGQKSTGPFAGWSGRNSVITMLCYRVARVRDQPSLNKCRGECGDVLRVPAGLAPYYLKTAKQAYHIAQTTPSTSPDPRTQLTTKDLCSSHVDWSVTYDKNKAIICARVGFHPRPALFAFGDRLGLESCLSLTYRAKL